MKKLIVLVAILGVAMFSINSAHATAGIRAIGAGVGYASPDNIDGTLTFNLQLDVGVPAVNFYVQPFIGFWSKSESASVGGLGSISGDIKNWMIGGNLKYVVPTSAAKVHPYVQGGIAAHLLSTEVSGTLLGQSLSTTVSDTKIGFQFGGGVVVDAGSRWGIFGQGQYHLVSDFNQWMIGGGLQINM